MKYIFYIVLIGVILYSCDGSKEDEPTPQPTNNKPTIPTLATPTNNLLCIDSVVTFHWNASTDPDNDAITYQIQVAKDTQFSQIAHTLTGSGTSQSISLEKGTAYYWRVKATDSKSSSSEYSTTYQFYTEGEGNSNHLPFSPILIKPDLSSVVQTATTTLEWTASDVDGNSLAFDVYFGTTNPPVTKVSVNQIETTQNVDLNSSTNYFWNIVVKDGKGGETRGQIWNFKTD
jgi:hypothetical protein